MTDTTPHTPSLDELEDVFRPADRPPLRHHRDNCECADPTTIIVDLVWGPGLTPERTATACRITGCGCVEFGEPGRMISGWLHCTSGCAHTKFHHRAATPDIKKAGKR